MFALADYVTRYTSKASDELEKRIKRVYKQAAEEVQKKLDDFIRGHKARNAQMLQMVSEGKMSKQDYQRWMRGQVFQGDQWKQKLKDVTDVYVHADEKAREIVGGTSKNVFMEAANYTAYDLEKGMRGAVAFNVYDAKTVERLLKKDPKMLPEWKIDQPKDYKWNEKRVRNAVAQGIIQGESVEEVGDRLTGELATSNAAKMDMFARTAINGAQNAGRMDRLHEAEEMGIEVKKKWLATLDNRTRDTHQALDGQEQPIDEPFVVDGMKIDYPGDPFAPPELVYNCRCTLTYVYPKYQHLQHNHERRDQLNDKNIENMTYYEWVGLKKREEKPKERVAEKQEERVEEKTPEVAQGTGIEELRSIAEQSIDKYDFWTNLDENQQAIFMASGMSLDDAYNTLHGNVSEKEWKDPSPGGVQSFAIKHDFSSASVDFVKVKARSEGWMADANAAGVINVREDGIGEGWEFIISHEAGHQLADFSDEIQQMIIMNPGDVFGRYNLRLMAFDGVYGEYNPEEAFATCVSNFVRHPVAMKDKYPKAYEAIDTLFKTSPSALDFVHRIMDRYRKDFL